MKKRTGKRDWRKGQEKGIEKKDRKSGLEKREGNLKINKEGKMGLEGRTEKGHRERREI